MFSSSLTINKGKIGKKPRQLFNLKNDPGERTNLLAINPSQKIIAKEKELYQLLNTIRGDKKWGKDGNSSVPR